MSAVERDDIGALIERGARCGSVERDGEYVGLGCVASKFETIPLGDNKQNCHQRPRAHQSAWNTDYRQCQQESHNLMVFKNGYTEPRNF